MVTHESVAMHDSAATLMKRQPVRYTAMPGDTSDPVYRNVQALYVSNLYRMRQGRFLWTNNGLASEEADSLITFIEKCRYHGLLRKNYNYDEIDRLRDSLNTSEDIERFDVLLTDAYLSMMMHLRSGPTARIALTDSLLRISLDQAIMEQRVIKRLLEAGPPFVGYQMLLHGLKTFLDSLSNDEREAVLANSHVCPPDITSKMRTIEVNLERWRSEKQIYGDRYVLVNIPAFTLYLVVDDRVMLESKVIVGTTEKPTPELSSVIECFVTYPYWNVPRKIVVEEYLPIIQNDLIFLERNNFEVLDRDGKIRNPDSLDWKHFNKNNFPFRLRQREGLENALGAIKFSFDNPYAVFLHDTNAKRLFLNEVRTYSHGCIRMEKAVQLAHYLVTGDLDKKSSTVTRFLETKSRHTIDLKRPIPIHVRYFTCVMGEKGLVFYRDVYHKDRLIADRLYDGAITSSP